MSIKIKTKLARTRAVQIENISGNAGFLTIVEYET